MLKYDPAMDRIDRALAELRTQALAAGATVEAVERVAPVYERALLDAVAHIEHRVVTELFTDAGWKPYPGVPLGSYEELALEAVLAAADASRRPVDPEVGQPGRRWIERRSAGPWLEQPAEIPSELDS